MVVLSPHLCVWNCQARWPADHIIHRHNHGTISIIHVSLHGHGYNTAPAPPHSTIKSTTEIREKFRHSTETARLDSLASDKTMAHSQTSQPRFPDRPYDFTTLTPAQHAHCTALIRLTHSRIDSALDLADEHELPSYSEPDALLPSGYITPSRPRVPYRIDAQGYEQPLLEDGEALDLVYEIFGEMLGFLCGEATAAAFRGLDVEIWDDDRLMVIQITEGEEVEALRCWQRGAEGGGVEGLRGEMVGLRDGDVLAEGDAGERI